MSHLIFDGFHLDLVKMKMSIGSHIHCSFFFFLRPFCIWVKKREVCSSFDLHILVNHEICVVALLWAQLTVREVSSPQRKPLGRPANLSAGCPVPTDINGGSFPRLIPLFWNTAGKLNSKQEKMSMCILGIGLLFNVLE